MKAFIFPHSNHFGHVPRCFIKSYALRGSRKFSSGIIFLNDSSTTINSVQPLGPIFYQTECVFLKIHVFIYMFMKCVTMKLNISGVNYR